MWKLVAAIHVFIFMVTFREAVAQTASSSCGVLSCFTNPSCSCVDPTTKLSWTVLLPIIISVVFSVLSAIVGCCCCYLRRKKNSKAASSTTENIRIVRDYDPAIVVGPAHRQPPVYNLPPPPPPPSVMSAPYLRPAMYHSTQLMGGPQLMGVPQLMGGPQPLGGYEYGWPSSSPYMSRPMIGYPGDCQSCTL